MTRRSRRIRRGILKRALMAQRFFDNVRASLRRVEAIWRAGV